MDGSSQKLTEDVTHLTSYMYSPDSGYLGDGKLSLCNHYAG